MVAFAAGTLLGGALLHMLPESIARRGTDDAVYLWLLAGFTAFFALEQLLHWRHSHRVDGGERRPFLVAGIGLMFVLRVAIG